MERKTASNLKGGTEDTAAEIKVNDTRLLVEWSQQRSLWVTARSAMIRVAQTREGTVGSSWRNGEIALTS